MPDKPIIAGITGISGKSSTLKILENIFRLNNPHLKDSFKIFSSSITEKPSLKNKINDAYRDGTKYFFLEISPRALSSPQIKSLNLNLLAVTNLSPEAAADPPGKINGLMSSFSKLLKEDSTALINADDTLALQMADVTHSQVITYALDYPNAMATAKKIQLKSKQSRFSVMLESDIDTLTGKIISPGSQDFTLPLPGRHNIYNALVAILISLACDISFESISEKLNRMPHFKRCLEAVYSNQFKIIDDGASNPGAIESVLKTISSYQFKKIILVFALSGNHSSSINALNGKVISHWAEKIPIEKIIITKSIHQVNKKARASLQEEKVFLEKCQNIKGRISVIPGLGDALQDSILSAREGDIILLLGEKGMEAGASLSQKILHSFSGTSG
ncbi:Mur ligase family protein [Candidatus Contubernalis alkaliaceticus]|uniref:Mur ligase family protein n=1 Tax=Candidatus Contubernalis alkaliaceticus TaxID=338645 RepID=UPI001F4C1FF3|nr:Mur ligase family protein [Candidatus Contubernalis alkalaceticus]UNC90677.1 hypothetical protein HUE98_00415 [Candidatus Contubernalis alkalaceticus]